VSDESPDSSDGSPLPGDDHSGDTGSGGDADPDGDGSAGSDAGTNDGADGGKDDSESPKNSITEGSLARPLFALAWPIIVIQLLQVTYNVVDTLYLGRLSTDAVGAISLAFPLIFLLIAVAGGFTAAGAILIAQYTGADGEASAGKVAGQTITFTTLLALGIGIFGYFYTRPALELLPSDPETSASVIPLAAAYIEIIFLGIPLMFGFFVFEALMRGYGETRVPMLVMIASALANVVLNPLFIFGFQNNPVFGWLAATPGLGAVDWVGLETSLLAMTGITGWGIEGAAVATILSRGLATVIGAWIIFGTSQGPTVGLADLRPDMAFLEDLIRLGIPTSIEQSTTALALLSLAAIVVTFSPPVVAAYGLGGRLISLVILPALGLGRAIDTMVGQNLGAGRSDRAERAVFLAATTGAGVMFLVAVVAAVFAEPIVRLFLGDVEQVAPTVAYGVEYVRIRSIEFTFIGVAQVILGAFRGAGNTKIAMTISIITLWVGQVCSAIILVFVLGWGPIGIWTGMAIGSILGAVVAIAWFARGTWKEAYIDEGSTGRDSATESAGGNRATLEPSED